MTVVDDNEKMRKPDKEPNEQPSQQEVSNKKEKKRVSFSTTTTTPTTKPMIKNKKIKKKKETHFGKADPIRDIFIFIGIVTFLLLISWTLQDVGNPDAWNKKNNNKQSSLKSTSGSLKQLSKSLTDRMKKKQENARYDCTLFLSKSSIPGAGFGIFAGMNYSQGETIMTTGSPFSLMFLDGDTMSDDNNDNDVPPYSLLLRHHPLLSNVGNTIGETKYNNPNKDQQLTATRQITAGEELFLPFHMHPHGSTTKSNHPMFANIPQSSDYKLVDEIIQDARLEFNVNPRLSKKKVPVIASALRMTKKAVSKFNNVVASLLPSSAADLQKYNDIGSSSSSTTSMYLSLKNNSHLNLATNGKCLDDIEIVQQQQQELSSTTKTNNNPNDNDNNDNNNNEDGSRSGNNSNINVVAKRLIKEGTIILPIPLYIIQKQQEQIKTNMNVEVENYCIAATKHDTEDNNNTNNNKDEACILERNHRFKEEEEEEENDFFNNNNPNHCLDHIESSLLLCPLVLNSKIIQSIPFVPLQKSKQTKDTSLLKNYSSKVAYRWSSWNSDNSKSHKRQTKEVIMEFVTSLSLDIIALKDIQPGEKIIETTIRNKSDDKLEMDNNDFFPEKWKDLS